MSKKPMYLKRRGNSNLLFLLVFGLMLLFVYAVKQFLNSSEVNPAPSSQQPVVAKQIADSVFKGKVEEISSPKSGIDAYYMYQDGGLISISFIFSQAGSSYEPTGREGIANIAAATLKEGAGWWSAKELRNLLGSSGIKISFSASRDDFTGNISFPNSQAENAVKYLREMLLNPNFEDKYVNAAKDVAIRAVEAQKEDPSTELMLEFNQKLFGDFAYGRNPLGNIDSIKYINRRALKDFVRSQLGKNKLFVGIVGNISRDNAAQMIEDIFGRLPTIASNDLPRPDINWQFSPMHISRDIPQNIALYAAPGTCRQCADFYPLYIANYILGGAGLNSRLNQTMREQQNLTYGVSSWLDLNDQADILMASFSATTANMPEARRLFAEIWQRAATEGFTAEELQQAQNHLVASHNLRFSSTMGIAEMLVYMQKNKLGTDFLNQRNRMVRDVTLEQLNTVAKKYFSADLVKAEIGINN